MRKRYFVLTALILATSLIFPSSCALLSPQSQPASNPTSNASVQTPLQQIDERLTALEKTSANVSSTLEGEVTQAELDAVKAELATLKAQFDQLKVDFTTYKTSLDATTLESSQTKTALAAALATITQLQAAITQLQTIITGLNTRIAALETPPVTTTAGTVTATLESQFLGYVTLVQPGTTQQDSLLRLELKNTTSKAVTNIKILAGFSPSTITVLDWSDNFPQLSGAVTTWILPYPTTTGIVFANTWGFSLNAGETKTYLLTLAFKLDTPIAQNILWTPQTSVESYQ